MPKVATGKKVVLLIDLNGELCIVDHDGTPPAYRQSRGTPLMIEGLETFVDGPTAGLLMHYRFGQSSLLQKVVLTAGSRRIDFVTELDWKESSKMLRTSFPVNVRSDHANCEKQKCISAVMN
ncbi:glycoside hydrolase family 38 C-terminal domain-containing protein [Paenibacillus harenae]|uniref:Glycosyl hydrolase family 38 C-terminal domain-containing protein n=1 Tax=Paenibacillus harenae TaxID=306543 RepID=A0ABT9TU84_PAEHA|nr:glycoside hydrolase family 38 C-terminal domain-containing protein [Paenibacillus harenae]MDQ0110622.1 hypothetical protein [Paenibacillus harenae]